jgi:hypothetical protein
MLQHCVNAQWMRFALNEHAVMLSRQRCAFDMACLTLTLPFQIQDEVQRNRFLFVVSGAHIKQKGI